MSGSVALSDWEITDLQNRLLAWFEAEQRDFPWRHTDDPYAILVAEKLLQQTAAREVVVKAFQTIMDLYPSPSALASAEVEDLETILAPLGLHYRARELKALADTLMYYHRGSVPTELKELKALPGVGEYIARAVLSFAYGCDVPVVDTNVARFLYRVLALPGSLPSNPARKKSLLELAARLVPTGQSREFNLAILDLCSLVCTATNPRCTFCPIQPLCRFGQTTPGQST